MACKRLGAVDGAVTTACAAEIDLQAFETALEVAVDGSVHKSIDMLKKLQNLAIGLEKADYRVATLL